MVCIIMPMGCGSGSISDAGPNITENHYIFHSGKGVTGELGPDLFAFTQSDSSLSGTTPQGRSITGTIKGLDINFSWVGSDRAVYSYSGSISADGSTMSGNWSTDNGQSGSWNAIINLGASVHITGTWNTYQTAVGSAAEQGPNSFVFVQTGDLLVGTTQQGQKPITGTGAISRFTMVFFWAGSDGIIYTLTGTINSAMTTMSGTWTNSKGASGNWRAVKAG